MNRRSWRQAGWNLKLTGLLGACLVVAGCELGRSTLRRGPETAAAPSTPASVDEVVRSVDGIELPPDDTAQGFFKPGRLSGGWSREANEIEASLGVPR